MVEHKDSIFRSGGLGTTKLAMQDERVSATDGQNLTFFGVFFKRFRGLSFEKTEDTRVSLSGSVFCSPEVYAASN